MHSSDWMQETLLLLLLVALVLAGLATLWVTWMRYRVEAAARERELARDFMLRLEFREALWESYFRSCMRWALRPKNRAVVDMVLRGELLAGVDKEGYIYLRAAPQWRTLALSEQDRELIEKRVMP